MKQIFIELFSYKESWRALAPQARQAYANAVLAAVDTQKDNGLEVVGWGVNDPATDRRLPCDFYCVYLTPSAEYQRGFEAEITAAGWYDYFEQINVSGDVMTPEALLRECIALKKPLPSPA